MNKIELLSPCGSWECLEAAIEGGCDAVYLGGKLFGARAFANNFDDESLVKAIKYAHLYGVKVYVTTNIIIYENEVKRFVEYVGFLHKNNVDAIIIQDLGMVDLIHQTYPNLELHASTQMHIHNLDGVMVAKKLGVKRCVLARETPIEVIRNVKENVDMDLEIFAHGALCVSYSGQCLFSSLIGHRSGNRGSCVGSCRLPYDIVDKNNNKLNKGDYPLSMKDLNSLEYIGELIDAGVSSLKIEGRMKSKEYVYTVTRLYREAIDSYYEKGKVFIDNKLLDNLKRIFNREFTKGYLFNEDYHNIINTFRPNHQGIYLGKVIDYKNNFVTVKTTIDVSIFDGIRINLDKEDYGLELNEFYIDKKLVKEAKAGSIISFKVNKPIPKNSIVLLTKDNSLNKEIESIINEKRRRVLIIGKLKAKLNEKLELIITDGPNTVKSIGNIVESSINNPVTRDTLINKLNKINDTVYSFENIDIDMDENIFIPLKELNELRRDAIEKLNNKRLYNYDYKVSNYHRDVPFYNVERKTSILVNKYNNEKADYIYSEDINDNLITKTPKVIENYDNYDVNKEYLVGELGAFNKLKNVHTDYSFNVVNSYTVALLHSLGAKSVCLSYELTPVQIENIYNSYITRYNTRPNLEIVTYGYREVMTLKTNLNGIYNNDNIELVDRFNNHYKIRTYSNKCYIYDYKLHNDNFDYYNIGVNIIRKNKEI